MSKNSNLTRAKKAKNDEFYTQATDIEKELKHYRDQFRGKVVYCNCDDPTYSEFWRYFHLNFHFFGMKELISTHYDRNQSTYALFYRGGNGEADDADYDKYDEKIDLKQDGDFRSEESIELLKRSDMVVTNEPWSLTREYIAQLMKYHKKFLIIVNKNAITYKEIFPLLMQNKLWIGDNKPKAFNTPNGMTKKISGLARWFTNMPLRKSSDKMTLFKRFDIDEFPIYDNYAAFNVDKVANIPVDREIKFWLSESRLDGFKKAYGSDCKVLDHNGNQVLLKVTRPIWGVPITFMDHYNPSDLILSQQVDQIVSQIDSSSMEQLRAKDEGSQMGSMSMDLEQLNQLSTANGNTNGFSLKSVDLISENSDSTAQQLNSSTAQQLNSSTAQQLNSSTAQQLNGTCRTVQDYRTRSIHNSEVETYRRTELSQRQAEVCKNLHQMTLQGDLVSWDLPQEMRTRTDVKTCSNDSDSIRPSTRVVDSVSQSLINEQNIHDFSSVNDNMAVLFSIIGRDGDLDLALNYLWFTPPEESRAKLYKGMNKTWRQQNAYLLINNKPQTCYKRLFIRERK